MIGKFNSLEGLEQGSGLTPNVEPDAFAVAPQFDSTEELRVEIDDIDESCPVRYTSDVRLILHSKDLASRAGLAVASKFGQSNQTPSQIQTIMDTMSDDDLLATVRSRYIQSPSEIIAWSKELAACAERLESRVQELVDAENAKQAEIDADNVKDVAGNAVAASAGAASSE